MLKICIEKPAVQLMDNKAVIRNTSLPSSILRKKHNAISYHKVCKAVAAGIVCLACVKSEMNRSDILTKLLGSQDMYKLTHGVLYEHFTSVNQGELQEDSGLKEVSH